MREHTLEISRARQMMVIGLTMATTLGSVACTPEQIAASMEYCKDKPDVELCLGQLATLGGSNAYMDGGQVTNPEMVMDLAGIAPAEYDETDAIINQESGGWCATRWQGHRDDCPDDYVQKNEAAQIGYGLPQATPPKKMEAAGPDWRRNPVTQLKWFRDYCRDRYGSITGALRHKRKYGWY